MSNEGVASLAKLHILRVQDTHLPLRVQDTHKQFHLPLRADLSKDNCSRFTPTTHPFTKQLKLCSASPGYSSASD